jgi:hypothetical protein
MQKVAIIGSHGLYAKYGGWDQLVYNLAENKSENIEYLTLQIQSLLNNLLKES